MTWRPAFWLVAAGVVAADLATKVWALNALEPYETHPLIGDLLGIQLVFNSGAAFSLGHAFTWVLTLIAAAVTVAIVYYGRRARSPLAIGILGAALGGAVGNLLDRLFRAPGFGEGHVVDMIKYGDLFVGNVADIAIVGAGIALAIATLLGRRILEPAAGAETAQVDAREDDAPQDDASAEASAGGEEPDARG